MQNLNAAPSLTILLYYQEDCQSGKLIILKFSTIRQKQGKFYVSFAESG
ncbi:hypothetical protein CLOLEP_00356 [[Clostridium] leptum DSM 753]|uniref:Uncharacterized protein n=1 Tax=[Clostridium] leptum DSM 753 TaxID=428125 RepID=A7VP80_9FIRM|nr:hypothetical protein CLOLEP_00356 [[Clostridium] leptum DSM 753]